MVYFNALLLIVDLEYKAFPYCLSLVSKYWTLSVFFCLQVLCSCLEANAWGPQSLVWPWTQLLSPGMPFLPYRGRPELSIAAPRESRAGNSHNPTRQQFSMIWSQKSYFKMFSLSFQCLKKAIMMDSENHYFWNSLGVISMSKGMLPDCTCATNI